MALAAVRPAIIEVTADPGFEHGLGDRDGEQIVLGRLEAAKVLGENLERTLDWRLDDDGLPLRARLGSGYCSHSSGRSAAICKPPAS
jgi:hypothetical protein